MKFEQLQPNKGDQLKINFERALDELRNKPLIGVESQKTEELLENNVELTFNELLALAELMQELKKEHAYEGLTEQQAAERIRKTLITDYNAVPHPYGQGWFSFRLNHRLAVTAEGLLRKECGDSAIRILGHRVTSSKLLVINVEQAAKFKLQQAA